ncbi:DHH family phosphoesterase [Streptococcus dentapri]|uniref:Cyclic-di-AMP phosphodiesterase n=1 Tax=Streptococcus dentapri TaxID=573564 RepID=A0ABV8D1Y4_9STRE
MRKIRLETIHLVMIGLIFFGILAICVRTMSSQTLLLLAIFIVLVAMVALLYYQKQAYELSELEQIERLNDQTELSLKSLLDKMPVGVVQFDPETDDIGWFNPYAELIFTKDEGEFNNELLRNIIREQKAGSANHRIQINGHTYVINLDLSAGIFYFFDSSSNEIGFDESLNRPVIGIIAVDNYDDTTTNLSDADVAQINSFIANFISEFAQEHQIYYRRVSMDRFYFFSDYKILAALIDDKFTVLENFRNAAKEQELPLTLSMGISSGEDNHQQIGQTAQQNLNIALMRGGDQAVIKETDEHKKALYFGGGTVSSVKRTRTRTRAMMTAISDRIKSANQVFVVGHCHLDMDALGAAVGMQHFAANILEASYAVYDDQDMNTDIARAVHRLQEEDKTRLITVDEALAMSGENDLLIMVDHSKTSLTLSKKLYNKFTEVIVVDHHRRDDDFPDKAILTFIESGASSASELVTELLQFQNGKQNLSKIQASLLMAGIMLDTKNFSTRVTNRTFDVASYLRTMGSDSLEIQNISATDFNEYRQVNELILTGCPYAGQMIIAQGPEDYSYTNIIASKAADTLLSMANTEASFVITKNPDGQTAISARSRNKINVQRIMEEMGGGGHFNLAACQLEDKTIAEARQELTSIIDQILEEDKEN